MRILWFTNTPFPKTGPTIDVIDACSGGWMWGLAIAIQQYNPISLGVLSACPGGNDAEVQVDGITHFRVAVPQDKFTQVTQLVPDEPFIKRCQEIVAVFKPDLIHIHGTEQTYGLLSAEGSLNLPMVISLQGLVGVCLLHYLGRMSISELIKCHSTANCVLRRGIIFDWFYWRRRSKMEERILRGNRHFIGRTLWDKAHLQSINRHAIYHHCDEVLRPAFYKASPLAHIANRQIIFAIWGDYPLKGTHVLLRALESVKQCFPRVQLRLAGGSFKRSKWIRGYWSYLDRLIRTLDLTDNVMLLPRLNSEQYVEELTKADVFVLPSFIENSPNSLCEAMLVGTPCVASYVGGVPTLVAENETALCFPSGEHAVLAEQLIRVLTDGALAKRISENAREVARKRHDRQFVARRMIDIYGEVLRK